MSLAAGTVLGPYEIVAPIGAGGMGEVYRARDARLGREVAVKILPEAFTRDQDRLERFGREARTLAALNHPNIASIYGVEESGALRGLVLELIEGPTVADKIQRGPLRLEPAVSIARQLVDALDKAHERGIVHRDLKPANIKVTPDGHVKILDFGLAKAVDHEDAAGPTATALTNPGVVLGTAAYMSPEQARGEPVDCRTDIWAFGCVLYEMLAGRRAFGGASTSDCIAAVIAKEPDWSALPAATPRALRRLLARCLDKDPRKRLRDIADARADLDDALLPQADGAAGPARLQLAWIAGAMAAGAAIAAMALIAFPRSAPADPMTGAAVEVVTRDAGLSWMPALSPDGKLIAYASDRAGRGDFDIWLQQVGGTAPLRLTDDAADDVMPSFSPDGSQVVFRSERDGGGLYVVPALGGAASLITRGGRWPRFSPDGTQLTYWTGAFRGSLINAGSGTYVLPLTGTPRRVLEDFANSNLSVWAPDGKSLLVLGLRDRTSPLEEAFDWWWVPLDGRPPVKTGLLDLVGLRNVPQQDRTVVGAWSDAGVVIASPESIWLVPMSPSDGRVTGAPRRMTFGGARSAHPTISRDGQIAFALLESPRVIERASLDGTGTVTLFSDLGTNAGRPSQTADGTTLVFERSFGASHEIWIRAAGSAERMVLRSDSVRGLDPVISPDGRRIVYSVRTQDDNPATAMVVDAAGGVAVKICERCEPHGFLSDGRRVLSAEGNRIRLIDSFNGQGRDLVVSAKRRIDRPHASPDDRWLAFRAYDDAGGKSYVVPLPAQGVVTESAWQPIEEPTTTGRPAGWSHDSRTMYMLLDTDSFRCVWAQRVDPRTGALVGGVVPQLHLHQLDGVSTSFGNPFTADGFMYATLRTTGNIWRVARPAAP
jgi:Tol biopolymer transport system component